jgi:hypothetical protein
MAFLQTLRTFFLGPSSPPPAERPAPPAPDPVAASAHPGLPTLPPASELMAQAAAANDAEHGVVSKTEVPKTPIGQAPGVPGFAAYGGRVDDKERSADMRGEAKWTTYRENGLNQPAVAAGTRRFLNLCGAPRWTVPPGKDATPEQIERAEFAQKQLENTATPWDFIVMTGCLSQFNGSAIQVTQFRKTADGRIGLADVVDRPMHTVDRWIFDEQRNVIGVVQRDPESGAEFPIERGRMVWSRDIPITDSPNGVGINRQIAEPVREAKALRKQLNVGFETDLGGVPVSYAPINDMRMLIGTTPPGMSRPYTQADFDRAIADVLTFTKNHVRTKETGLVLDSGPHRNSQTGESLGAPLYKVELLQAGGKAHGDLAGRLDKVDWWVLAIIGAEYIALGADGGGSLAMAKVKSADFYRLVTGALNRFARATQRDVLRPLWALNGWDPEEAPLPDWDRSEFTDPLEVAQTLLPSLATSGIMLDRRDLGTVNPLVTRLGLAPIENHEGDLLLDPKRRALAEQHGLDDEDDDPEDDGTPGVTVDEDDAEPRRAPL